jgi:hypothetical protein
VVKIKRKRSVTSGQLVTLADGIDFGQIFINVNDNLPVLQFRSSTTGSLTEDPSDEIIVLGNCQIGTVDPNTLVSSGTLSPGFFWLDTSGSPITLRVWDGTVWIAVEAEAVIADDSITADMLQTHSVTSVKIAPDAVTASKIAVNSISTTKIQNEAITLTKLAQITASTLLGNNTGSSASPLELTPSQVKTMLVIALIEQSITLTVNPGGGGDFADIPSAAAWIKGYKPVGGALITLELAVATHSYSAKIAWDLVDGGQVLVRGLDPVNTIIAFTDSIGFEVSNGSTLDIDNLTLQGVDGGSQTTTQNGVNVLEHSNLTMGSNVTVKDFGGGGVAARRANRVISSATFRNLGNSAVAIDRCQFVDIKGADIDTSNMAPEVSDKFGATHRFEYDLPGTGNMGASVEVRRFFQLSIGNPTTIICKGYSVIYIEGTLNQSTTLQLTDAIEGLVVQGYFGSNGSYNLTLTGLADANLTNPIPIAAGQVYEVCAIIRGGLPIWKAGEIVAL